MNEISNATGIDWNGILQMATSGGVDFGIRIVAALAIFIVGRIVARMLQRGLKRLMAAQDVDQILQTFVSNLAYWTALTFVIIAAINQLGVQTTSLIAVMGAAGLAVGLAMQGSLSNFAAGVLIVVFRPYRVGDWVEAAGIAGSVEQVQILTTVLKTGDNKRIIVPNSQIMGSIITNYSANETRRIDMVVGVSYEDDIDKVRSAIREVVEADSRVLQDPACTIAVAELADSSVNFVVRPWVGTADYWAVKFDLTEAIKKRFDRDGISIPFPQRDVHVYNRS